MAQTQGFKISLKTFFAKLLTPVYFWLQKKFPKQFEKAIQNAGSLDYSAMQSEFNSLHQIFFQNMLSQIQCDKFDLERIRHASEEGQIVYMMRNWGQIEYNYFNSLFLKEKLPLASHANLIRMIWWMPLKSYFYKMIARLHHFYTQGSFPDLDDRSTLLKNLTEQRTSFVFLNQPLLLNLYRSSGEDLLSPLLEYAQSLPENKKLSIIPLDLLYDRRPGKADKSLIDILFGEKENPGSLRKMVLFFRNYRKRAVAKVGSPLDVKKFIVENPSNTLQEQSRNLRNRLHQDFYKEISTVTGPTLKSRESMIDLTLQDKDLRQSLMRLSTELDKPLDELYLTSQEILEEIVADPNYTYLDLWDLALRWVFKNIYDGLIIDEEGLSQIKKLAKDSPLVLIPSHRSHMDYLLISDIFYQQKLSMPLVAAGANLSFWPMGHIFRRSGAFFMRRSFGSDPLYPLLFKSYIKTLLQEGFFQEFFIEGTCSRTGKLEEPKTGMLSLYLDCYFENHEKDFYFVPVSINYEKVLEDKSHVQESKGGKKEKESFWDLLKVGRFLRNRYGHVYVNFGEAISAKNYLLQNSLQQSSPETEKRKLVKNLAYKIAGEIDRVSVITAPNLVAAALLAHPKKGQNLPDLLNKTSLYQKALIQQGSLLSKGLQTNTELAIQQALQSYVKQGLIQLHQDGNETFYILEAPQRPHLDYYRNALLAPLIHLCLGSWILKFSPREFSGSEFQNSYETLREKFQHEFIQIPDSTEAIQGLLSLEIIQLSPLGNYKIHKSESLIVFSQLIAPLIEAYQLCAQALENLNFVKWEEKNLIQKILAYGNTLHLKGDLQYPEALSQFLIKNALHTLRDEALVLSHEKDLGKKGRKTYSHKVSATELQKWTKAFSSFQSKENFLLQKGQLNS